MNDCKSGLYYSNRLVRTFNNPSEARSYAGDIYKETNLSLKVKAVNKEDYKYKIILQFGLYNDDGNLFAAYSDFHRAKKEKTESTNITLRPILQSMKGGF